MAVFRTRRGVITSEPDVVKTKSFFRCGRLVGMYLRRCYRAKDGKRHAYWALVKSVRTAFRIHKSDLKLRPIWHQKESRVEAHILVCFLAYVIWKTLGQMCRAAGLGDEPRKVFEELSGIQVVDVIMPTRRGVDLPDRLEMLNM